jgi:hypothetical protein
MVIWTMVLWADNGAMNLQSYDVKEILNKRIDGKGPI